MPEQPAKHTLDHQLARLRLPAVKRREPVGGGSINEAFRLVLADGRSLFLKQHPAPPKGFFAAEAKGLEALTRVEGVRCPRVLASGSTWLLLEWIESERRASNHAHQLAEMLARLHGCQRPEFGFEQDNYCGLTPQPNAWTQDGHQFFAEQRLLYQARLARDRGLLDAHHHRLLDRLCQRLPDWIPRQPASLIHGDLWGGNLMTGSAGEPVLIDPAAHYGWAEADLAMTTLFGSLPESFYRHYQALTGLPSDWWERRDLYNLYHLLNHLNLFGRGYLPAVENTLQRRVGN